MFLKITIFAADNFNLILSLCFSDENTRECRFIPAIRVYTRTVLKPKIYFMRKLLPEEEELVKDVAYYRMFTGESITREITAAETRDVDAVSTKIPSYMFLDAEILKAARKLRVINIDTNTFDMKHLQEEGLDVDAATRLGICITNTPVGEEGIADKAFSLLLCVAMQTVESDRYTKGGNWKRSNTFHARFVAHQVHDTTIGILGLGRIGQAVARRAKGFNMKVLYYDIIRKPEVEKELGAEYVALDTLLSRSDYISIHTGSVRHLIGEKELKLMKKNAILINTARGECVDSTALVRALKEKRIAGAGLDVFEKEPIDSDDPLITLPNVVLTPHSGLYLERYVKMTKVGIQNILNVLDGKMPPYLVNKDVLKVRPLKD
jgi:glyoxylate reductase